MSSSDIKSLGSFVWSVAEFLRGDFKQSEYGKAILPFVVLRHLDCILDEIKPTTLEMAAILTKANTLLPQSLLRHFIPGGGDTARKSYVVRRLEDRYPE